MPLKSINFLCLYGLLVACIYMVSSISYQTFLVQAFKIDIDSWKFHMLLLYILFLWFQLQMNSYSRNWNTPWLSQLVNFKNATETYGMLQTDFQPSCINQAPVFELHKRFKEGSESVRDDERCGRSKEVNTPELIGQRVRVTMLRF